MSATQDQEQQFAIQQTGQLHLQETSATARAAAETAMVQARCVMALQRPRDWDTVRERLMRECARPGFADVAIYKKPLGGGKFAEGMSVRFAEAAMRHLSNFHIWTETIYNDAELMEVKVSAMDLETNVTTSEEIMIQKTVERGNDKDRVVVGERTNTNGKKVYIVLATDSEIMSKVRAELSKARRNLIMQLLPGDISDDCEARCREVQRARDAKDPDAAKKRLFDSFSKINVSPIQLKAYLGHANPPSPAELSKLRGIYAAIESGETTWAAVTEETRSDAEKKASDAVSALKTEAAPPVAAPVSNNPKPVQSRPADPDNDGR